ncbi:MAG: nucleoside-triphosphatase [Dehalococcoidales bacterium]|nr:nucleoside-triphosphatase [Dehalococcoidales bacterium]MDP7416001.1 nucleoside-triphosphatase [Dehalococcoidales bacterium]
MRSRDTRLSFKLMILDGQEVVLAHVDIYSRYQVGKYGVDIGSLDQVGVSCTGPSGSVIESSLTKSVK